MEMGPGLDPRLAGRFEEVIDGKAEVPEVNPVADDRGRGQSQAHVADVLGRPDAVRVPGHPILERHDEPATPPDEPSDRAALPRRRGQVETTELIDEEIPFGERFAAEVVGRDLERGIDLVEALEDSIHRAGSTLYTLAVVPPYGPVQRPGPSATAKGQRRSLSLTRQFALDLPHHTPQNQHTDFRDDNEHD
jgi:hypothetical protein